MRRATAKYVVFLCAACVVADAEPRPDGGPTIDLGKQRALHTVLEALLPERDRTEINALLVDTLSDLPGFSGGIAFLRRIEAAAQRAGEALDHAGREAVLGAMITIAEADDRVTFPELTVLRASMAHLGLPKPHRIEGVGGRVIRP